jgi:hypothetical protein
MGPLGGYCVFQLVASAVVTIAFLHEVSAAIEMDLSSLQGKGAAAAEARPIESLDDNHRKPKLESFTTVL